MRMPPEFRGKTALVTGASSGLGKDFATALAESGVNLVLCARREDRLRELANALMDAHCIEATVIPIDLAVTDAAQTLFDEVGKRGITVDVLINNAGFGNFGAFVEIPWEDEYALFHVNAIAPLQLTKLFVRGMIERGEGWVLQVASIGAYQPSPTYVTYAASKSLILSFAEALSYELRDTNVKVRALSPGVTDTEFFNVAGQEMTLYHRIVMMRSRRVADIGLSMLSRRRASRLAGLFNELTIFAFRLLPRRWTAMLAYWTMRNK